MARLVVVGGGISGLSAAHRFSRAAPEHSLLLVERETRAGGKIGTLRQEGFLLEDGPESFLTRKTGGVELCRELGIAEGFVSRTPRGRSSFILHEGRLHPLPEGFSGLVPSDPRALDSIDLLSEAGKQRLREEARIPPSAQDSPEESIAQFMSRRFGREAFDLMIEPLLSGIFAGDARRLSLEAAFPQLLQRERSLGHLSGGGNAAGSAPSALPAFVSFAGGMEELTAALVRELGPARIVAGGGVRAVGRRGRSFSLLSEGGEVMEADAVVLATPPDETARMVSQFSPPLAEAHAAVPSASTVVIHLGYRIDEIPGELDGYGYIVPTVDGRPFHACTWSSSKWPGRAPAGYALLRLYGGRFGGEDPALSSDRELLEAARAEMAEVLGITRPPVVQRLVRWPRAIPQYNIGHRERLGAIEQALAGLPGLFLAGAAYRGVGIPDCIESGRLAAEAAADYLRRR